MQRIFRRRVDNRHFFCPAALIFIYFYCSDHTPHMNTEPCTGLSKINLGDAYTCLNTCFFCGGGMVIQTYILVWHTTRIVGTFLAAHLHDDLLTKSVINTSAKYFIRARWVSIYLYINVPQYIHSIMPPLHFTTL